MDDGGAHGDDMYFLKEMFVICIEGYEDYMCSWGYDGVDM